VGGRDADGFSLNVSNFETTADNIAYGKKVSALTGNAHFVIDTSRNGNGATTANTWCNPSGRAVGELPTLTTNVPLVDAFLWIKPPGESDGTCGASQAGTSAPAAGQWWPQYALALLGTVRP
jgi:endoglucanase